MKTTTCTPETALAANAATLRNPSLLRRTVTAGVLFLAGLTGLHAQDQETKIDSFVSFQSFMEQVQATDNVQMLKPGSQVKVKQPAAFQEMRQHLLNLYKGTQVTHSYVRDANHFDCMPVDKQPAVLMQGIEKIAARPPKSLLAAHIVANDIDGLPTNPASQDPAASADDFGNTLGCEANTVPVRRVTLEEMAQFPTLHDFFQKNPEGTTSSRRAASSADLNEKQDVAAAHKYSYMTQYVNNLGGTSNLNVWSPYVNTGLGEVFSLSQEWYVGGSGTGLQTAEVGWQNYPAKYGNESSRLFIYYTADNYGNYGCYNLECGAFVQVSNTAHIGGGFVNYSTVGGTQYDFSAEFYLYQGNWWLAIQGVWVGYYPGSVYRGGQLTRYATLIEFGTEGVGTTYFPPEGSGNFSTSGWGYAAYQRNLFYHDLTGATVWDSLTQQNPSPRCYSVSGPYSSSSSGWARYFYEGGPGGTGCQ